MKALRCALGVAFLAVVALGSSPCSAADGAAQARPAGQILLAQTYPNETPAFCDKQLKDCLAACEAKPENRADAASMSQCRAYCQDVRSGCGK